MKKTRLTKKEQQIIKNYYNATAFRLWQVYTNYSVYKARAEHYILEEMLEKNGFDYRIIGYNCNAFSCGYCYKDDEGNKWLRYHTAQNAYDIPIYLQ